MRTVIGGVLALLWLGASVALWAGQVHLVPLPEASAAIGLSARQSILLSYALSGELETLAGAFVSLALAGLLAGLWLLVEGLVRKVRLATTLGGAIAVLELAMGLFSWLRADLLLRSVPSGPDLLSAASMASELAVEVIPAALLLALALGAILVSTPTSAPRPRTANVAPVAPPEQAPPPGAEQEPPPEESGEHSGQV